LLSSANILLELNGVPASVSRTLEYIFKAVQIQSYHSSICIKEGLTQEDLIPLAAVLLEYPVGYVPVSSQQTSFLNDVPLDVYECVLIPHSSGKLETLLQFSCPCALAKNLSVDAVKEKLEIRFLPRITAVNLNFGLQIIHHVETLPRVGL
jgi:Domain of unknown function (DUF4504)